MLIDYAVTKKFEQTLNIVDPGRTAIRCTSYETGLDYYIITKTVDGKISLMTFGPVFSDMPNVLDTFFNLNYSKFDFKDEKIKKSISTFVNDPKKQISDLEEITEYEALKLAPNLEMVYNNL